MSADDLSISFASSIGIDNIRKEYLNKNNANVLYTDLDQLEKSVEAEFEQYINQARTFPFNDNSAPQREEDLEHDVLDNDLLNQANDELDLDNDSSWRKYLEVNDVDEKYNVTPLRNKTNSLEEGEQFLDGHSRNTSPGEYFGARSLPLDSLDWQPSSQQSISRKDLSFSSSYNKMKQPTTTTKLLLESRFKALPKSLGLFPRYELPEIELHHPYTQKNSRSSKASIRQQKSTRGSASDVRSLDSNNSFNQQCTIEPSSTLHFLCEISPTTIYAKLIHLRISNHSSNSVRPFSLFSSKNMLEFEMSEGVILEHEVIDIKIKIQSSALSSYRRKQRDEYPSLQDKVLVLIDHQHITELDVHIDFMLTEEEDEQQLKAESGRPKCRYCALEQGYPLHCL